MLLLDGFQRAGWPTWMASPLPFDPYDNDAQVLRDTVKNTNYGHRFRLLRFTMDIPQRYVGWRLATSKKKAAPTPNRDAS
jgi:hypothetical protein